MGVNVSKEDFATLESFVTKSLEQREVKLSGTGLTPEEQDMNIASGYCFSRTH